jgi:L-arabinose isomerase
MSRCGLLLLGSQWFKNTTTGKNTTGGTYADRLEKKTREIIHHLSKSFDVTFPGIVYSKEDVIRTIKLFVNEEVDFIIATFMSWTEDSAWIRFLRDIPDQ